MEANLTPEVIERIQNGDTEAFALVVEMYQTAVFNLCSRMLFNTLEAEDAAQETFWKAWSNIKKYDPNRSFVTWLLSIAAHHCIDLQRKRKLPTIEIDEAMEEVIPDTIPQPAHEMHRKESEQAIQQLLQCLSETDRAAIIMRYWHELSEKEIAESLRMSESAVKSRLFRARRQMAWQVQENEPAFR